MNEKFKKILKGAGLAAIGALCEILHGLGPVPPVAPK